MRFVSIQCSKVRLRPGHRLGPHWGSLQHSPDHLAGFKRSLHGGEGRWGNGKEGEERERTGGKRRLLTLMHSWTQCLSLLFYSLRLCIGWILVLLHTEVLKVMKALWKIYWWTVSVDLSRSISRVTVLQMTNTYRFVERTTLSSTAIGHCHRLPVKRWLMHPLVMLCQISSQLHQPLTSTNSTSGGRRTLPVSGPSLYYRDRSLVVTKKPFMFVCFLFSWFSWDKQELKTKDHDRYWCQVLISSILCWY